MTLAGVEFIDENGDGPGGTRLVQHYENRRDYGHRTKTGRDGGLRTCMPNQIVSILRSAAASD
jgi:hypothetical protein